MKSIKDFFLGVLVSYPAIIFGFYRKFFHLMWHFRDMDDPDKLRGGVIQNMFKHWWVVVYTPVLWMWGIVKTLFQTAVVISVLAIGAIFPAIAVLLALILSFRSVKYKNDLDKEVNDLVNKAL